MRNIQDAAMGLLIAGGIGITAISFTLALVEVML